MLKAAASVTDGGTATLAADLPAPRPPRGERVEPMKTATPITRFTYSTGARPLDGYTIKRGIGAGGFGEVYFAVSDAGKEVAIKRIQRNLDVEIRGVSQCLNLKHPNLVSIHDIRYDDEGQAWVVMEYVRGESLKDDIERHPDGMPVAAMLEWFSGICAGVEYLHDHGIVHRDLKPGNIFRDEGVVKIGDYGLSKYISCSRRSGQTESVGTFHYMAPEIGRGVYGKEIDLYALGIILYELLSGRVPFDGESSHEIIMKHLTALPDVSSIPVAFRSTIERALFKDPSKRFSSVKDLFAAVERAAAVPSTRPVAFAAATSAAAATSTARQPFFIDDAPASEGIYFGPVQEVVKAEPIASPPTASRTFEEPIAAACQVLAQRFLAWWNSPVLNRPARILLGIAFAVTFAVNVGWLAPLGVMLALAYLGYFGIRAIVLSLSAPPPTLVPQPMFVPQRTVGPQPTMAPQRPGPAAHSAEQPVTAAMVGRPIPARRRKKWSEVAREQLRAKTYGERLTELTGSMLMAAVVICVGTLLSMVMFGIPLDPSPATGGLFAWSAIVSLVATWSLLMSAKMREGRQGEDSLQRFFHLLVGLGVGLFGWGLAQFLGVSLRSQPLMDLPVAWRLPAGVFAADGEPQLAAFLIFFGGLFAVSRWWLDADPMRSSRFSIWSTAVTMFIVCLWLTVWPFPQPWSLAVPLTMSIALQLSSTWLPESERQRLRKSLEA